MGIQPFEDLPLVMQRRSAEVVRLVTGIAQEAIVQAGGYAAMGTPVDEGVARSNWIPSKNGRIEHVIPAYAPGSHLGQTEQANLQAVIAAHRKVAESFNALGDTTLHSTNSVEYIGVLNYTDYSAQAEPGFFERAIPYAAQQVRGKWRLAP